MEVLDHVFTEEELSQLRNLPEVIEAYEKLSKQNVVYFSIPVEPSIKQALYESFGINLFGVNEIPFRWIKGDTTPHIDRGQSDFDKTYLVYLTDSEGQFQLGEESYPIEAGTGFSFSEGLSHSVVGTNGISRLLLGPMSEQGLSVGAPTTIQADGQTETVSFVYESGSGIYYRINGGDLQNVSLPITIENTNTLYTLKVLFETDIIVESIFLYFICGSDNIQFGSTSLKPDGTRPTFIINVNSYDGVFYNGQEDTTGYNNISIYNLAVDGTGYSLQIGAGWLCQKGFGNGTSGNYIVNCSSGGDLPGGAVGSGGIVGAYAGRGGSLTLIRCSSSGNMGQLDGGIVGQWAGFGSGSVTCEQCYTTGTIGDFAGGIFGDYAGDGGSATATKCYTTGSIGGNGGGIYGRYAGNNGQAVAQKCYSRGSIGADGGGIFGIGAASDSGTAAAINCYSSGSITTTGNGIYGTGEAGGATITTCYSADSNWSNTTANNALDGVPGASDVGTTWIRRGTDLPYELNGLGYTPYTLDIINSSSELVQTFSETLQPGNTGSQAIAADASGNAFTILQITGGDAGSYTTITMSSQRGAISTTSATVPGTYTITLRSVGSYNITIYILLVTQATPEPVPTPTTTCCQSDNLVRDISYEWMNDYKIGRRLIVNVSQNPNLKFNDYSEYVKYKMALGSGRI